MGTVTDGNNDDDDDGKQGLKKRLRESGPSGNGGRHPRSSSWARERSTTSGPHGGKIGSVGVGAQREWEDDKEEEEAGEKEEREAEEEEEEPAKDRVRMDGPVAGTIPTAMLRVAR